MIKNHRSGSICICLAVMFFLVFGLYVVQPVQAAGGYLIKVNRQCNCVTIYQKKAGTYRPIKALVCSTGYATLSGTYHLGTKMRWHVLNGPCYGQYCSRIYGGVLFHSVWYTGKNNPSTLSVRSYNKLGTTASHGCVRLTVAGAKWIYDHVPSGTTVVIYRSSKAGPLGKPLAIKMPYTCGWDPTDTGNSNNPWNHKKPAITGVIKNRTLSYGAAASIVWKKGVHATNTTGFDVTSRIRVDIRYRGHRVKRVDTRKPGLYHVIYRLTDEIGRKTHVVSKVFVKAGAATPKITVHGPVYVTDHSKLVRRYLLKQIKATQSGKKLSLRYVQIKKVKLKQGIYRIIYKAQRKSQPVSRAIRAYVDKKAPVITGVHNGESREVPASTTVNKQYAYSLIQVSDQYTPLKKRDVKITISKLSDNSYKILYSVSDQAGNQTKVNLTVTILLPATPAPTI